MLLVTRDNEDSIWPNYSHTSESCILQMGMERAFCVNKQHNVQKIAAGH